MLTSRSLNKKLQHLKRTSKLSSAPMGNVSTSGLAARLLTIMSTVRKKLAPMRSICAAPGGRSQDVG